MPIKRYGNPFGKPVKRPKGRRRRTWRDGDPAPDVEMDEHRKDQTTRTRVGRREGDIESGALLEGVKKASEIERRHKRAQKERIAGRRNRKRLKKAGKKIYDKDPFFKAIIRAR